jgi:heme/copper-type cytochrome/quinol oxidase subunit 2
MNPEWFNFFNDLMRRMLTLPEQASTLAIKIDLLHYFVFIGTMAAAGLIGVACLYFFFKYREREKFASTPIVEPSLKFEFAVVAVPLVSVPVVNATRSLIGRNVRPAAAVWGAIAIPVPMGSDSLTCLTP